MTSTGGGSPPPGGESGAVRRANYRERLPECSCFENAREMVKRHPELRYVEGWLIIPCSATALSAIESSTPET
jgi:hypothetical protein